MPMFCFLNSWQSETTKIFDQVPQAGGGYSLKLKCESHCGNVLLANLFNGKCASVLKMQRLSDFLTLTRKKQPDFKTVLSQPRQSDTEKYETVYLPMKYC
jgi:hypothetical protein